MMYEARCLFFCENGLPFRPESPMKTEKRTMCVWWSSTKLHSASFTLAMEWTPGDATRAIRANPLPCERHVTFGRGTAMSGANSHVMHPQRLIGWDGWMVALPVVHRKVKCSITIRAPCSIDETTPTLFLLPFNK